MCLAYYMYNYNLHGQFDLTRLGMDNVIAKCSDVACKSNAILSRMRRMNMAASMKPATAAAAIIVIILESDVSVE